MDASFIGTYSNACNTVTALIEKKCLRQSVLQIHSVFLPSPFPLLPRAPAPSHHLHPRVPSRSSTLAHSCSLPQCSGFIFTPAQILYVMHIYYTHTAVVFLFLLQYLHRPTFNINASALRSFNCIICNNDFGIFALLLLCLAISPLSSFFGHRSVLPGEVIAAQNTKILNHKK